MNVKQAIKAVLPKSAIDQAIDVRERVLLTAAPRQDFDPRPMRPARTIDFSRLFADEGITATWQEDHCVIASRYGDEDRFGGVNPGDRRALYFLVMALRPRNVLEVGTHIGASTIHIAAALKRLGQGGTMTTIDIVDVNDPAHGAWKKIGLDRAPRDYALELGLSNIEFQVIRSLDFMATIDRRFDLIFLDGDHSAPAVYREVGAALPLLNDGGLILLHDYYPSMQPLYPDKATIRGPFRAMERVRRECPSIAVLPLGELPWPTKQGVKVTTLALLARAD